MPYQANAEFVELGARELAHEEMTSFLAMLLTVWSLRYGGTSHAGGYNEGVPNIRFYRDGNALDILRGLKTPDLLVEVIPRKDRDGDPIAEHAAKGIRELWLVDPDERTLERRVLDPTLGAYAEPESFRDATTFRPPGFEGLTIPLDALWRLAA